MGGDHGHSKIALPDWRQWKIDGTPLELTHRRLKANNLKDPWLRNEAWRFSGQFSRFATVPMILFKGFKWGFAAFAVRLAVEYTFLQPKKGEH
ncbi:NADH dehydrogenase [ubiquinone] 1 beta subcomplex subunit 3 [Cynoglossus semilaevis]|uniref:NADH dehydrogenase [ubiquinone] 1 beta subcomplex subunit 3 n=1 Tax=Cynoglossus semilaevis TaxID=244447 RepID=A0A3P8VH76_CYNSE|nr:NADH dehydrogenase [ubiquinone] 1 beta subcomplex subunit 3 [Cynoglossus semilaevis]